MVRCRDVKNGLNLETPSPTNRESRYGLRNVIGMYSVSSLPESILYADFFDFLDRKVPLHGVYSRMDKSLDRSVLDTPENLFLCTWCVHSVELTHINSNNKSRYEGQVARPDPLKPRPLNMLTRRKHVMY